MTKANEMTNLSDQLVTSLQSFQLVLLTSIKEEAPYVSGISWVYAASNDRIRFAVDSKSQIIKNIKDNQKVSLTIFSDETIYTINGNARVVTENLDDIPFSLAMVEVTISEVLDTMFYGSKITSGPKYEKTYNKDAAEKLDHQVMEKLKA